MYNLSDIDGIFGPVTEKKKSRKNVSRVLQSGS